MNDKKGNIMNRAIKFKLKNGKVVTIRRVRGTDADKMVNFLDKFSRDPGAVWTAQYAGQPKANKEGATKFYDDPNNCVIGVWDGDTVVGMSAIMKQHAKHPYYMGVSAGIFMFLLQKYTHNGLGTKMLQILEKWAHENGVKVLTGEIRHMNIPSIVNCLKSGFLITGIHHNAAKVNGKIMHEYVIEKILTE